ncbi:MAG: D-alanine--D-alanine ligase family protein [Thermodesulfobacteriota bacterium]
MSKLTVGVIFGGRSVEHEVSLLSAKSIISSIDPGKYDVFPIFIEKSGTWRRASVSSWLDEGGLEFFEDSFLSPSLNPGKPVFYEISGKKIVREHAVGVVFPVLHGTYGEDGTVQGMFELMGIPYVGASVLGSAVGMDKIVMKTLLKESGLPVVGYLGFYKSDWESGKQAVRARILKEIGIPCFIKSANLGSSVGITKVNSEGELDRAVAYSCRFSERVIVERAVRKPREIEVSVLGNDSPRASCAGEVVPHREFYDYTAKYLEEGTGLIAPAELDEKTAERLRDYAVRTFRALDCSGMGRVDFLIEEGTNQIYVSEINTIPGFTQISMYPRLWEESGVSFPELVNRLIELAVERRRRADGLESDYSEISGQD